MTDPNRRIGYNESDSHNEAEILARMAKLYQEWNVLSEDAFDAQEHQTDVYENYVNQYYDDSMDAIHEALEAVFISESEHTRTNHN